MESGTDKSLLNEPIAKLGFSKDFVTVCELAGFYFLGDLVERHTSELLILPGFSYHWLEEYINFLELHHLGDYIDPD